MEIVEIAKLLEENKEAMIPKMEFFFGVLILNSLIRKSEVIKELGIVKLSKEGRKHFINIELNDRWSKLLDDKDVKEVLFLKLRSILENDYVR